MIIYYYYFDFIKYSFKQVDRLSFHANARGFDFTMKLRHSMPINPYYPIQAFHWPVSSFSYLTVTHSTLHLFLILTDHFLLAHDFP